MKVQVIEEYGDEPKDVLRFYASVRDYLRAAQHLDVEVEIVKDPEAVVADHADAGVVIEP